MARFQRLASLQGIAPPQVTQIVLPDGSVGFMSGAVPVVRVVFPERAFFAFNSDVPLPDSGPILDVIAENMRQDLPDAALTVLGHTDAIGSDTYNMDLSRRRAAAVMAELIARHVRPGQMSAVAIGKRQPIASNDTQEGRALNRRVEFLISAATSANLAAVQRFTVPEHLLDADRRPLSGVVDVFRPAPQTGFGPDLQLQALQPLPLNPLVPDQVEPDQVEPDQVEPVPVSQPHVIIRATRPVVPAVVAPRPAPQLAPLAPVEPREIGPAGTGPTSY